MLKSGVIRLCLLIYVLAGLALAASFAGAVHPAGDAFAVIRIQAGLVAVGVALPMSLLRRRLWLGLAGAAFAVIAPALWASVVPVAPDSAGPAIYQKNLSFRLADPAALIADIRTAAPDVVMLQEVNARNQAVLAALAPDMPHQILCPFARVGGVAVASRWPMLPGTGICLQGQGLTGFQAQGPDGPVWLISLHLHWPWPYRQSAQLDALIPVLERLEGPVILAGDFNMVPWSDAHRRIARAARIRRAGPASSSYPRWWPWAPLPIDHVYGPDGGAASLRPALGSDHMGILAILAR